jgi:hypothetical protein
VLEQAAEALKVAVAANEQADERAALVRRRRRRRRRGRWAGVVRGSLRPRPLSMSFVVGLVPVGIRRVVGAIADIALNQTAGPHPSLEGRGTRQEEDGGGERR